MSTAIKSKKKAQVVDLQTPYLIADGGNGTSLGVSNCHPEGFGFESVIAPKSTKRELSEDVAKLPIEFSLKQDKITYVFGLKDCRDYGKRNQTRQLVAVDRQSNPDWHLLLRALMLKGFDAYVGTGERIEPLLVISVPISQYENKTVTDEIINSMSGEYDIEGDNGCALLLNIRTDRVKVIPEGFGAFNYAALDKDTLGIKSTEVMGKVLVYDQGFETVNAMLIENCMPIKGSGFTIPNAGFSQIVKAIQDWLQVNFGHLLTLAEIDHALRPLAALLPGTTKMIEAGKGWMVDITEPYDQALAELCSRNANAVMTHYSNEHINMAILSGGSMYHCARHMADMLCWKTKRNDPHPEWANAFGADMMVRKQLAKRQGT